MARVQLGIFVFSSMRRSSGFALVPWQRKGSSSRAPRFEINVLGVEDVEVWNPDLKSSHNFVSFVGPRSVPISWESFFVCVMWAGYMWKMEEDPVCAFPAQNDKPPSLGLNPLTGPWLGNLLSMAAAEQMLCILSSQRLGGNYVANMTCGPLRCIGPSLTMPIYSNYTLSLIGPSRLKGRLFSHVFSELLLNIGTFSAVMEDHPSYLVVSNLH